MKKLGHLRLVLSSWLSGILFSTLNFGQSHFSEVLRRFVPILYTLYEHPTLMGSDTCPMGFILDVTWWGVSVGCFYRMGTNLVLRQLL